MSGGIEGAVRTSTLRLAILVEDGHRLIARAPSKYRARISPCLHDWHGPGYGNRDLAILIEHADDLLTSGFLGLFVSVLAQAAWSSRLRLGDDGELAEWRQRIAQHFVFLLDHTGPVAFTEEAAVDWPGGDPASAPWTVGPLSFADNEILSGTTIKAIKLFRDHLGCSIHDALAILQSRSEHLRREQGDD
ncbi:hypothetical protein [Streptomyces sp. NPDC005533]|uniref:hypothetical protein n=1 Tax=Streptomyces sp. NPDC005533 TaxID=3364723 RepID=UPI0036BAEA95